MNIERWQKLSFKDQIGNITSEVARARFWAEKNDFGESKKALKKALELVDLSFKCCNTADRADFAYLKEGITQNLTNPKSSEINLDKLESFGLQYLLS